MTRNRTLARALPSLRRTLVRAVEAVLLVSLVLPTPARAADPITPEEWTHTLVATISTIENEYVLPIDGKKLREGALRGMVEGLDPHSAFLSAEDLRIFEGDTSGRFGGVGLEVDFRSDQVIVIANVEGSPAARAGIEPGHKVIAIEGYRASELKPHEIVRRMRGIIGTQVSLTVSDASGKEVREVRLSREEIRVKSVQSALLAGDVLFIRIKAFQEGTHDEFLAAIAERRPNKPNGIILDLRNNPGGLVREAVAVADEFLESGTIFSLRARGKVLRETHARGGGAVSSLPTAVLVNEFSASAAELVAGALQDLKRAPVLGSRSFGKGSVQSLLPLTGGAALKLTTALYHTPSGRSLQAEGITPDAVVEPLRDTAQETPILRENDIRGRLDSPTSDGASQGPPVAGLPLTDEELRLGVARTAPPDPRRSRDNALRAAHSVLLGETSLQKLNEKTTAQRQN
jgi:carboxyl-terminal processing protease